MPVYPLGPVNMVGQSMTLPAKAQGMFEGGMKMQSQGMDGRKNPGNRIVLISPAVNGSSVWDLDAAALSLNTTGSWTITPLSTFNVTAKMWGTGGGFPSGGAFGTGSPLAGAGGYAGGVVQLVAGTSYTLRVNHHGGVKSTYGSWGGGYSALLLTSGGAFILLAGGGGGQGGRNSGVGGAGGSPSAGNGAADDQGNGGGTGGNQSSAGSGGAANTANTFWANGSAGSGTVGGQGGYSGGSGGGGYKGGGGGSGSDFAGAGGGGGSSYYDPARVTQVSMLSGSGGTPGNASDPDRGTAGSPQTSYAVDPAFCGKIVLK